MLKERFLVLYSRRRYAAGVMRVFGITPYSYYVSGKSLFLHKEICS